MIQTAEGLSYTVVAGFALASVVTRVTTGSGLREAELDAAAADVAALKAAAANNPADRLASQRAQASMAKAEAVAGLPSQVLNAAEVLSLVTAVVGLIVLALQIVEYGYIPEALPLEGAVCWGRV